MDAVHLVSLKGHWTSNALKEECRKWFSLLLDAVEIKDGVVDILGHFLTSGKAVTLDEDYRLHIGAEVCTCSYVHSTLYEVSVDMHYTSCSVLYSYSSIFSSPG